MSETMHVYAPVENGLMYLFRDSVSGLNKNPKCLLSYSLKVFSKHILTENFYWLVIMLSPSSNAWPEVLEIGPSLTGFCRFDVESCVELVELRTR